MLLLLSLLTAFPPISTAMYLPAIPKLVEIWQRPLAVVNLTLVGFFVSYCVSLLIFGPLSDRFGRRRPLLTGIGMFVVTSLLCAGSNSAAGMIVLRVLQAVGAGAASTLALAISKDVYEGNERERVLAYIGVIMALAPMLSPVFGGWIMTFFSWRWIFVSQGLFGAVAWIGVWRMPETLEKPTASGFFQTAGIYLLLFQNRRYIGLALLLSIVGLPHFAFIGGSADIYISRFGLTEQIYGYFFALNAAAMMAGAYVCTLLLRRMSSRGVMALSFAGVLLGGLGLLLPGFDGPWGLAIPMAVTTFSVGLGRPPSNNLVLEQVERHAGAASSILIFIYFMIGAFSMWLISFGWVDKIHTIGFLGAGAGGFVLVLWLLVPRIGTVKKPEQIPL